MPIIYLAVFTFTASHELESNYHQIHDGQALKYNTLLDLAPNFPAQMSEHCLCPEIGLQAMEVSSWNVQELVFIKYVIGRP